MRVQEPTCVTALHIEGVNIRVSKGDIADEDIEALLNPTSIVFDLDGLVSQAILAKIVCSLHCLR